MKTLLLIFASIALPLSAAEVGQAAPKLPPLLPGAKLPGTSGKVVLVDFWASWCGPCKASFPAFGRLREKYGSRGLVIIGIGVDDDASKHDGFLARTRPPFPVAHDQAKKAAAAFAPKTMPTSYLIDRKGVIRHIHSGFKGAKTEAALAAEIEALLK